jgi:hypothetical protein
VTPFNLKTSKSSLSNGRVNFSQKFFFSKKILEKY